MLQVRLPDGKWTAIEVIATGPRGRFDVTYPSEFLGVGHWQLRILCETARNYPFAGGASKIVAVRVSRG